MSDDIRVTCLECGSEDIRQRSAAYTDLEVWSWTWNAADGIPEPTDVNYSFSPEWEPEDVEHQFRCGGCGLSYRLDQLLVTRSAVPRTEEGQP